MNIRFFLSPLLIASFALWLAGACGAKETTEKGSSSATSGSSDAAGSGSTDSAGGGLDPSGVGGFNPTTAGGGGMETCLTNEAEATPAPLDMVVLLDRSYSMKGAKWDGTVSALSAFFQDPGGAGIAASLSYFPPTDATTQCQTKVYEIPKVPVTELPLSASVLVNDIQAQTPGGNETPTYAALYGTLLYANQYQEDHPEHTVAVVLASDGDPTACEQNVATIAALAATAFAYNGVRTFAIAINGSTLANLDQIAAAGGTVKAFDVTNDVSQLKLKLQEIRTQLLACEFTIPDPSVGSFDATKVNVEYTPGGGGVTTALSKADNQADCGNKSGWYYDFPAAPTKITLCPASCADIKSDLKPKIAFLFGCPTALN